MTAPALVMVTHGSSDPSVTQVSNQVCRGLHRLRPGIQAHCAFLDHDSPSLTQVIEQLVHGGINEIALVPLQLISNANDSAQLEELLGKAQRRYPNLRIALSRSLGPELTLLTIIDQRLRTALSQARCLELDGLVLAAASTGDMRGSALLARRARQWSAHHRLPCLTAVADDSGPSVAQAIMGLRAQGRRHIAVGSFFLAADEAFHAQSDLAYRYGAVAVSEPIGSAQEVVDLALARYSFAAMDLLDFGLTEAATETNPVPHLRVVGA
jgi:sirohydrochlorin ferrochelatase